MLTKFLKKATVSILPCDLLVYIDLQLVIQTGSLLICLEVLEPTVSKTRLVIKYRLIKPIHPRRIVKL